MRESLHNILLQAEVCLLSTRDQEITMCLLFIMFPMCCPVSQLGNGIGYPTRVGCDFPSRLLLLEFVPAVSKRMH